MKYISKLKLSMGQWLSVAMLASSVTLGYAVTIPNSFTAGTPAKASEVNANFDALKAAVDALETKVNGLRLVSGLALPAVPMNLYSYFMSTSSVAAFDFGQVQLRTTGTAGQFVVCGDVPGSTGTFNYVVYVEGNRFSGTVGANNGCTGAFTVSAGGDFAVSIRRAHIIGVHSGDGTTANSYNLFGFSQL